MSTDPHDTIVAQAQALITQGLDHCREEQWDAAIGALAQALALVPDNPVVLHGLGVACNGLGRFALAEQHLSRAAAVCPQAWETFLQIGLARQGLANHEGAAESFHRVLALYPGHTEAYFFLGQTYGKLGRWEDAAAAYLNAIELYPDFYQAFFNLGLIYQQLHRPQDAERCLRQTVHLSPSTAEAWSVLAQLAYEAGRADEAGEFLAKAVALAPTARKVFLHNSGLIRHRAGDRQEGLRLLSHALDREAGAEYDGWGPQRVRIEVSSRCNLRCRHCPTGTSYQRLERTLMDASLFERLLRQLKTIANLFDCVMYLGGEPLLHPELPAMIGRIKAELPKVKVMFNTNGMLLTDELSRRLAASGVDHIEISIDGRSPEENDAIRRGGRYQTVRDNIRCLQGKRPYRGWISIANTVLKRDGDPETASPPSFLQTDFPEIPIHSTYAMQWPGVVTVKGSLFHGAKDSRVRPPQEFCTKPFTEMAVRANGDLVLCCYDLASEKVMGNINETDLLAVWHSLEYTRLRSVMVENRRLGLPELCRKCVVYTGSVPLLPSPIAVEDGIVEENAEGHSTSCSV